MFIKLCTVIQQTQSGLIRQDPKAWWGQYCLIVNRTILSGNAKILSCDYLVPDV